MTNLGRLMVLIIVALVGAGCGGETSSGSVTSSGSAPTTEAAASVEFLADIPYAEGDGRQVLDVYLPVTGQGPFPTVLAIHGGGFSARSKSLYSAIGPYYAEKGFAFVAINYRLSPDHSYPAQVEDSFCALAWLHQNAVEYGFDTNRVVVWGGSAGGYLASMVGAVDEATRYLEDCPHESPSSEAVHAAVIFYGLYDFRNVDDFPEGAVNGSLRFFWGAPYDEISTERLEEMSPIAQIDGSEPPFIILHGTADTDVPSVMSERFMAALEDAGVEVELVLLPGVGHAFEMKPLTGDEMSLALSEVASFLERTLDR